MKGFNGEAEPTAGFVSQEGTGRNHEAKSEAGQGIQGSSDEDPSIPLTIGAHAGPLGGEVGIDLAVVPDVAQTGLAALEDGINFLGQLALSQAGLTSDPNKKPKELCKDPSAPCVPPPQPK